MNLIYKLNSILIVILFLFLFRHNSNAQTVIVRAFPNLVFSNPVDIQNSADSTNRIFIVEQKGNIKVFNNNDNVTVADDFLNIENQVLYGGEQGLLGLAFHPNYKNNGYFYIDYTASSPRRTVISRFTVSSSNPNLADQNSEVVLLEIEQPYSNHNGGQIAFGPDGYLYVSFGDGGSGGDPDNNGQNLTTLLGSIIRIDVDNKEGSNEYAIPNDNLFKNNSNGYREEIFAYGLRNVWRFSFDNTEKLWAADVEQNKWEEINLIENGKNYGWRIMEGFHCFNPSTNCNQDGLELPIWEYDHSSEGGYSITGGFVYRGIKAPELFNKYVYADFVNGNVWTYDLNNSQTPNSFLTNFDGQISTFGVDENKELYIADYSSGKLYSFADENVNSMSSYEQPFIKLFQNYPNPFNPSTTISYQVGSSKDFGSKVRLDVFNLLGENIITLVNEYQKQGFYKVEFSNNDLLEKGISLTSGIYFYRLNINNFVETRKMALLN